jgi:PAS domain-containing protein
VVMLILLAQAEADLGIFDAILKNADKLTIEVVIMFIVFLIIRYQGRYMGDQSKENLEQIKLMQTAFVGFQDNIKTIGLVGDRLEKRFDNTEAKLGKVADDVYAVLTKPGGVLFTLAEQNQKLIDAVDGFVKTQMNRPLGVIGIRPDGTIVSINQPAVTMLGVTPERIVGSNVSAWADNLLSDDGITPIPSDQAPAVVALKNRKASTRVVGFWHRADQRRVWLLVRAEPAFDASGTLSRVVTLIQDVGLLVDVKKINEIE